MSLIVRGFRPPDERWQLMKAAWDACTAANIELPAEVVEFFGGEEPDEAGVDVEVVGTAACQVWRDDTREGFDIDVRMLPSDVNIIRVYNSW